MVYKTVVFLVLCVWKVGQCEESLNTIGKSTEAFSTKVYQELASTPGNLLISPISVQTVLGLVQSGAHGKTLDEMSLALSLPANKSELEESFARLQSSLKSVKDVQLESANIIYLRSDIVLSEDFNKSADHFDAEVTNINLGNLEEAAATINNWVENKTHEKIKDIVKKDMFTADTAIVLVNALYFNAGWEFPFDERYTHDQDFYVAKDKTVQVPMMYTKTLQFLYENSELDASFLDLVYKDPEFALTIVLPKKVDGLVQLEQNLDKVLQQRPNSIYEELVEVWLPKFKIEGNVDFKAVLEKLGVQKLFHEADLSGITNDKRELQVSTIIQKTFIDVNEKGTEAAAASVAFLEDRISGGLPKFKANHPFIFILRQRSTGIIQFIGRYTGP